MKNSAIRQISQTKPLAPGDVCTPELWEQARHRVERIAEVSRDRSPDTVMYLTMTELQGMFPTLTEVEVSELYLSVKAKRGEVGNPGRQRRRH